MNSINALLDPNIQTQPFFAHVDETSTTIPEAIGVTAMTPAPQIGGTAPAACGILDVPGSPTARLFFISGAKFTDWIASTIRPILPNTGNVMASWSFLFDGNVASLAEAFETDYIFVITGADGKTYKYNGSLQWNNAKGGSIQIGNWQDTGIVIPEIAPDVLHTVSVLYAIDTAKHTITIGSFAIDGKPYAVNVTLNATPVDWKVGAYRQIQLDRNSALAGQFSVIVDNDVLAWW